MGVCAEGSGGNEQGTACAQGDIAAALPHHAGTHGRGGVVAGSGDDLDGHWQTKFCGDFRKHRADYFITFKELRHLSFLHAADIQHLLRPAPFDVQQQHAACIGEIAGVDARKHVVDIVLGQHDLCNAGELVRFVLLHPEELGRCETRESDVGGEVAELPLAHGGVEPHSFLRRTSVVPKDRRADHVVVPIQSHKTMHLSAAADARDLRSVKAGR